MLKLRPLPLACLATLTLTLAGACGFQTGGLGNGIGSGGGTPTTSTPVSSSGIGASTSTGSITSTASTGGAPTGTASASTTASASATTTASSSTASSTSASSSSGIANGGGCGGGVSGTCTSGFCVSGLCCDSDCTGKCMTCDGTDNGGTNGTCLPVIGGADPFGNCAGQGSCNGKTPEQCSCQDSVANFGESDVDCGGSCPNKCATYSACGTTDSNCVSGDHCQLGACCPSSCSGPCASCDLGAFWPAMCVKLHIGDQGGCPTGQACNNGGIQTCTNGVANGGACPNGNNDCVSHKCVGGTCVIPNQNFGFPCKDNTECDNGHCQSNHFCG